MSAPDLLWRWLIHAAVLCGLVLIVGTVATRFVRQPADRLRLIQWVLVGCVLAPWVGGLSSWRSLSIDLVNASPTTLAASYETVSGTLVQQDVADGDSPGMNDKIATSPVAGDIALQIAPDKQMPATAQTPTDFTNEPNSDTPAGAFEVRPIGRKSTQGAGGLRLVRYGAVAAYLCYLAVSGVRWLTGWRRLMFLKRNSRPASAELRQLLDRSAGSGGRRVRLLVSDQIDGPFTWGVVHPVIALPARFADHTDNPELRWSLAHEWSHVERRDIVMLQFANVVQMICFYQPLFWWLRRQLVLCQDFIADARASRETDAAEDYAEFLTSLARFRLRPSLPALGIIERKSQLFLRVKMLIDSQGPVRSRCRRSSSLLIAAGSLAFLTMLSTIQLDAAGESDSVAQPTATEPTNSDSKDEIVTVEVEKAETPSQPTTSELKTTSVTVQNADQAEVGVVKGVLVNEADGAPVAGARIILRSSRKYSAESDAEGRFRLENIPASRRPYQLWAHEGNLITLKRQVDQTVTENGEAAKFAPLHLKMSAGKQAKFRVTSAVTGEPIEGAVVRFGYPDRRKTTTAADGVAVVQGLMPQKYEVTIEAERHARHVPEIELARSDAVTEYEVSLAAGAVVRGVATDEEGKPLADVDVVYYVAGSAYGRAGDAYRTDAEGRFRHRFLPLNTSIEISLSKKNYISQKNTTVITPQQSTQTVEITLPKRPPGGSIAGLIQDSDGNPVKEATVANHWNRSEPHQQTITDSEGKFLLHDLVKGYTGHVLHISAKGFSPQLASVKPGRVESPGSVTVTLKPGHTIRIQVVDENGHPAKSAQVWVRSGVSRLQMGEGKRNQDDGLFAFDSLPADARFDVYLPGYPNLTSIPLQLDTDEPILVKLQAPGVIRGRVLDAETKEPLQQFRVRLGYCRSRKPDDPKGGYDARWENPGLTFRSTAGKFVFEPLLNGLPLELTVIADGYERFVIPRAVAARVEEANELSVSLKRDDPTQRSTQAGRIVDYAGKPAGGAQLRLIVSTNQPAGRYDNRFNWALIKNGQLGQKSYCDQFLSATTDAQGRFEFRNIPAGKYLQLAYWGPGVPQGRSLAFDETQPGKMEEVTIKLPQPARVRGTIERAQFPNLGSVRLTLQQGAFQEYKLELSDDQTTFAFADLPPGKYSLAVCAKPVRYTENGNTFFRISPLAGQKIRLQAGELREVEFTEPNVQNQ